MPHLFFAASENSPATGESSAGQSPAGGQNMWGKTWHKVGGWLKKEDEENEPPAIEGEQDHLEEKKEEQSAAQEKPPRPVMPSLPRPGTFARQNSEMREKLCPLEPDPEERRAISADRKAATAYIRKPLSPHVPHPLSMSPTPHAPDVIETDHTLISDPQQSHPPAQTRQGPNDDEEDIELAPFPTMAHIDAQLDQEELSEALDDLQIQAELEAKWILNLSMHFRDNSDREKFFITYADEPNKWRRVTISCDYRDEPADSLEADLKGLHYQRDKSARIYESIRDSLESIQFYPTVTNLKLQTSDGRLHVHVTEDVNEKIQYPQVSLLRHLECPRIKESDIEFDSHLSGFVYKIRTGNRVLIKKEIPGPEAVEEFLYEVNALSNLRGASNVVHFEGLVVDDDEQLIKGLLIGFCEQGALVDVLYDYKDSEWLPWSRREQWAKQIVKGLSDIHEAGFVQGDFTLSNIVIDREDTARIIDINRRGCPVGWEPPELAELIRSGQRISIYIGVKSDLYQLGMVLWALAEQQDEPERQEPPLKLSNPSEIPAYYRQLVGSCLSTDPRKRQSAKELFAMFPALEEKVSERQPERETRTTCLSPHRSEKEYIDPATAVDLEDINQLKVTTADSHRSQFSASEATFADGATSTEYLFVSSGSDMGGPRGRSPASYHARGRRRSKVSIDLDLARSYPSPIMPMEYDPRTLDQPTTCADERKEDVLAENINPTTPMLRVTTTIGVPPDPPVQPVPEYTLTPDKVENAVPEMPPPPSPSHSRQPTFPRAFKPPLHQDSGFQDLDSAFPGHEPDLKDLAHLDSAPNLTGLGIDIAPKPEDNTKPHQLFL